MGEETKKQSNTSTGVGCLVLIVLFVVLCIWLSSCLSGSSEPEEDVADASDAFVMSGEFVKENLKAPATADFPWYQESFVKDLGDGRFKVNAYVDAENSFGAKIRVNYTCTLKYLGNDKWQCENIDLQE